MINYINITPGSACLAPANAPTPNSFYLMYPVGAYYGCTWASYLPENFKNKQSVELKLYVQGDAVNVGMTVFEMSLFAYDANGILLTTPFVTPNSVNIINPTAIYTTTFELSQYFVTNASWFILGLVRDTTFYAADVYPNAVRFLDAVIIPSTV